MTRRREGLRPGWFLAAAIVWAALIFAVSQVPGRELARLGIDLWDKAAHALEYAPLGAAVAAWLLARDGGAARPGRALAIAVAVVVAYGASDELHQAFVPGRQPAWSDVAADAVGGGAGALVAFAGRRWIFSRSRS